MSKKKQSYLIVAICWNFNQCVFLLIFQPLMNYFYSEPSQNCNYSTNLTSIHYFFFLQFFQYKKALFSTVKQTLFGSSWYPNASNFTLTVNKIADFWIMMCTIFWCKWSQKCKLWTIWAYRGYLNCMVCAVWTSTYCATVFEELACKSCKIHFLSKSIHPHQNINQLSIYL